jgi:hypothetical protein
MSIVLQSSGGGSVTIAEPATASNFTATLPAATGDVMVSGNMPAFSAYLTGSQTLSSGTSTKITFDTEVFDTNNNFASSRFTPTVAGYYQVNAMISVGATATRAYAMIYKNGSLYNLGLDPSPSTVVYGTGISSLVYCNGTTDYIEIYGLFASGQTVSSGSPYTWFNATMVRSA